MLDKAIWENDIKTEQELLNHPELSKQIQELLSLYDEIDNLGYSEMPSQAYEAWLKTLDEAKQKQDNEKLKINLKTIKIND